MKRFLIGLFVVLFLVLLIALAAPSAAAGEDPPVLTAAQKARKVRLIAHLEKEFPGYAGTIVRDPRFAFDPYIVARAKRRLAHPSRPRPPKNNFDYVVDAWAHLTGIRFIGEYDDVLSSAEAQFGIDKEAIAGIFAAESDFGDGTTGTHRVIQSLYTIYVFMPRFQEKKNDPRSGAWAEEQLDAFVRTSSRDHADPFAQLGSWTGAEGLVQFEPAAYEAFAMRYDGTKCVSGAASAVPPDLSGFADSICSAANYLHAYWGASDAKKMRALMLYNKNKCYAAAILDDADYWKGKAPRHPRYIPVPSRTRGKRTCEGRPKKAAFF